MFRGVGMCFCNYGEMEMEYIYFLLIKFTPILELCAKIKKKKKVGKNINGNAVQKYISCTWFVKLE